MLPPPSPRPHIPSSPLFPSVINKKNLTAVLQLETRCERRKEKRGERMGGSSRCWTERRASEQSGQWQEVIWCSKEQRSWNRRMEIRGGETYFSTSPHPPSPFTPQKTRKNTQLISNQSKTSVTRAKAAENYSGLVLAWGGSVQSVWKMVVGGRTL